MIKVILNGFNGKMGHVVRNIVQADKNLELVAGIDINEPPECGVKVYKKIEDCKVKADVIIDFSTAKAVKSILDYAKLNKIPAVICTTGISDETIAYLKEVSTYVPIFFSANMSLGVNLMINLAKKAASILYDSNFDIEIIEKHHNQKIDAPSGTALAIATEINQTLNNECSYKYDRTAQRVKRDKHEIGIHSVRGGNIVGEHEIIFAGLDEILEFKHTATSKEIFAVGAVKAAKYIVSKRAGLYDMGNLVD